MSFLVKQPPSLVAQANSRGCGFQFFLVQKFWAQQNVCVREMPRFTESGFGQCHVYLEDFVAFTAAAILKSNLKTILRPFFIFCANDAGSWKYFLCLADRFVVFGEEVFHWSVWRYAYYSRNGFAIGQLNPSASDITTLCDGKPCVWRWRNDQNVWPKMNVSTWEPHW